MSIMISKLKQIIKEETEKLLLEQYGAQTLPIPVATNLWDAGWDMAGKGVERLIDYWPEVSKRRLKPGEVEIIDPHGPIPPVHHKELWDPFGDLLASSGPSVQTSSELAAADAAYEADPYVIAKRAAAANAPKGGYTGVDPVTGAGYTGVPAEWGSEGITKDDAASRAKLARLMKLPEEDRIKYLSAVQELKRLKSMSTAPVIPILKHGEDPRTAMQKNLVRQGETERIATGARYAGTEDPTEIPRKLSQDIALTGLGVAKIPKSPHAAMFSKDKTISAIYRKFGANIAELFRTITSTVPQAPEMADSVIDTISMLPEDVQDLAYKLADPAWGLPEKRERMEQYKRDRTKKLIDIIAKYNHMMDTN